MIPFNTELGKAIILEDVSELPDPPTGDSTIYVDFETTGFFPYAQEVIRAGIPTKDRACGVAVLFEKDDKAYYVPYRHRSQNNRTKLNKRNLPVDNVLRWLKDCLFAVPSWTNHNVKFDAHFANVDGIDYPGNFVDTVVASKIHLSDRFSYDLKPLCRDWFDLTLPEQAQVHRYIDEVRKVRRKEHSLKSDSYSKEEVADFSDVPPDILGPYACMDVFAVRKLIQFLDKNRPEQVKEVWRTDQEYTRYLYEMEKRGMRVDEEKVNKEKYVSLYRSLKAAEYLQDEIGYEYTDSPKVNASIFLELLDLPILKFTSQKNEDGKVVASTNPSFDKEVLEQYGVHPQVLANERSKKIVDAVVDYRNETGFLSRYINPFEKLRDSNGYVHPSYNQLVRTGRSSCSDPNLQGVSPRGRELLIPSEGKEFVSVDASQLEFRFMVHYMNDRGTIEAYLKDKKTDFHQWVATICEDIGLKRKHAKNINFAIGYGAGKPKVVSMLEQDPLIIEEIAQQIVDEGIPDEKRHKEFKRRCRDRAIQLFETYHARFPVKAIATRSAKNCRRRGFVFNIAGRRRHLPFKASRKAFNSAVQSSAKDFIKSRALAIAADPVLSEQFIPVADVHDELLFETEIGQDTTELMRVLETSPWPLRVPIYWDCGRSTENWRIAAGK